MQLGGGIIKEALLTPGAATSPRTLLGASTRLFYFYGDKRMQELAKLFDGQAVRIVVIDDQPWFVGRDVAELLGYVDTVNALKLHCKGVSKYHPLETKGGMQDVRLINEPDLYRLIGRSKMPEAVKFEKWVFEEVLPSLRKTGRYEIKDFDREKSKATRNILTSQWQAHGATKPAHYINLTLAEYKNLFDDPKKRKATMTKEEQAKLMAFEAVEYYKLITNQELQGYRALVESIEKTAKMLPEVLAQ
jgi:prophage antirepressor-like protein